MTYFLVIFLGRTFALSEAKPIMADAIVRHFFSIFQGSVYKCVSSRHYSTEAEDRGAPLAPALRVAVIRAGWWWLQYCYQVQVDIL